MLLENMQRADLTVYEQAQGFQMMLDLGETQEGIAEKTGFSKTTIRHRLKLLELDPIEFQKAQERQATFSDYIELEKLKRPESKTEALMAIGTPNFTYTIQRLITRENAGANAEKATAFLDSKLKKIPFDNRFQYRQIGYMPISKALTEERQKEIDSLIAKGAKYYTVSSDAPEYAWAYIYTDPVVESEEDRAEKQKRDELANMRREREQRIREEEQRAHDLRKKFVKDFANREYISTLTEALLTEPGLDDIDYEEVAELLGIELSDNDTWHDIPGKLAYKKIVKEHPESLILAMLYTIFDCGYNLTSLHNHEGRYERNPRLENWYAILTRVKYKMSIDERKLLSGTHDCFK
jgi:ParB family chromosome partitioning protein